MKVGNICSINWDLLFITKFLILSNKYWNKILSLCKFKYLEMLLKYFSLFNLNGNKFNIVCNNDYNDGNLLVNAVCTIPGTEETLSKQYSFKLKGLG